MNRSLAFIVAFAFAAAQPAVTLGAPPGGLALSRPVAPAPHPAARVSASQDSLRVPFHLTVEPLAEPQRFALRSTGFNPQAPWPTYRYRWQSTPGYLWYPALYGAPCSSATNLLNVPNEQLPADLTLGSLVDGKSNLLSPQSYNAAYAIGNDPSAASSNPFALQVGFYPMACGAPGFTNL